MYYESTGENECFHGIIHCALQNAEVLQSQIFLPSAINVLLQDKTKSIIELIHYLFLLQDSPADCICMEVVSDKNALGQKYLLVCQNPAVLLLT